MNFNGKTVVVGGGTGNIGWNIAHQLLKHGVEKLAIFDINYCHSSIDRLLNEFPKKVIVFRKTDVTNRLEVQRSFKEISHKFNRIDIVINNAGVMDETDVNLTIDVNLVGVINFTQVAVDFMSIEKGGRGGIIANVSSLCGVDALFANPVYTATKHAVVGFTRSLGTPFYFNVYGIKFIVLCAGLAESDLVNDLEDRLYRVDAVEPTLELLNHVGTQTPEEFGKLVAEVVTSAKNGSVWVLNRGIARDVTPQNEWLRY